MRQAVLAATLLVTLACMVGCGATQESGAYTPPSPGDTPIESELATGAVPIPVGTHRHLGPSIVPTEDIGPDTPFQFVRLSFSGEPLDEYWVGYPTAETAWAINGSTVDVAELANALIMHAPSSFDVEVRETGVLQHVDVSLPTD